MYSQVYTYIMSDLDFVQYASTTTMCHNLRLMTTQETFPLDINRKKFLKKLLC